MSESGRTLADLAGTEPIQALNAALAKAQGAFGPIERNRTVKTSSYSYSYATLDTILEAVRPALAENGLALIQLLEDVGQGPSIRTELRHADGGVLGASFPLPKMPESPQQLGSLLTYLRRYAIVALLGIAPEEDDDASSVETGKASKAAKEPEEPKLTREEANLIEQINRLWTQGRSLDELLGNEGRDWTLWSRHAVGLVGATKATTAHWAQIIPKLQDEIARMQAELEQRSEQETLLDEAEQAALAAEEGYHGEFKVPAGKRGDGGR